MKLFLDDIRDPPDNTWKVVRSYEDCTSVLFYQNVQEISLDHDLGEKKTGYDIVIFLEKRLMIDEVFPPAIIRCHSANPVGRERILRGIKSLQRLCNVRGDKSAFCNSSSSF